jgi:hypothetical protein
MPFRERPLNPVAGRTLSTAELNRMAQATQRASAISGEVATTGFGTIATPSKDPWIWAKITAANSATPPKYSWTQVVPDAAGGFTVTGDGASGTDTSGPAYEINGTVLADFPVYVKLYLGPDWFYFDSSGSGGGGSLEFQTFNPGTGDVATVYNNVTLVQVDQASGLNLSLGVTFFPNLTFFPKLAAQPASDYHAGVVTLADQTLGLGDKTFSGNAQVQNGYAVYAYATAAAASAPPLGTGSIDYGAFFFGPTLISPLPSATLYSRHYASGKSAELVVDDTAARVVAVALLAPTSYDNAAFAVVDGSGNVNTGLYAVINYRKSSGASGTLTFKGGLLVAFT